MVSVDQGREESLEQDLRIFDRKVSLEREETLHDQTGVIPASKMEKEQYEKPWRG